MSREDRKYSRVYWSVNDDPKFDGIRGDSALFGTWVRLLMVADAVWPSSPTLPRWVTRRHLSALVSACIVDVLPEDRFRIRGMDAERSARSNAASNAAASRWNTGRNAKVMLDETSRDETRRDEQTREGLPNLDRPAITVLEERTGELASQAGERQLSEYDRLVGRHGLVAVSAAFDSVSGGKPMTARQLVWAAMKVLEPFVDPKSVAQTERAEESDAAHRRRLAVTQRELRSLREVGS